MNGQTIMVVVFMVSSVMAMYIETILQIYVCVTAQKTSVINSPAAIVSLSMTLLSYLMSSMASAFLACTTMRFDGNLTSKFIFRFFHVIFLGMLWRIFKLIMSFSKSDIEDLAIIRLFHVGLQSGPYIIIYSSIFVSAGNINAVQVLSLSSSAISTMFAISCFNLRLKLCNDDALEGELETGKGFGCFRMFTAIFLTCVGTLMVISTRFTSLSLMASQESHWILLPLGCHILALLVIFIRFSSRLKAKRKIMPKDFMMHCIWAAGMSILNIFDLVHDNIERVMCKYVGFYSFFLIENIVFLSFWLLRFEMDSIGKLFSVLGIVIGFIVGIMIKFAGCNMIQEKMPSTLEAPSHTTILTISNISSRVSQNKTPNNGNDLVSIVQASVYRQSLQTDSLSQKTHRKRKRKSADNCNDQQIQRQANRARRHNHTYSTEVVRTPSRNEILQTSHNIPLRVISRSNFSAGEGFRRESDSSPTDRIDLDNSFQPDSMFNVSDPGTIRSDMMYDNDNSIDDNDGPQDKRDIRQQMNRNNFLKSILQTDHSRISSTENTMSNDAPQNSVLGSRGVVKSRGLTKSKRLQQNQNWESVEKKETQLFTGNFESLQPNECSDTAISSAKTFPMETKKADLKSYENALMYKSSLGRKMNKIIYSLEDSDRNDLSLLKSKVDHSPLKAPNSDDDIFRYKYNRGAFHVPRNRISYTDCDDLSPSENPPRSRHVEPKNITLMDHDRKSSKLPKRDSQPQSNISASVVVSPSTLQLCESGSSSFSSMSFENKGYTKTSTSSSSSSTSTKHLCWADSSEQRREDPFLPDEESQIPSSENILRWLAVAGTEETHNEEPMSSVRIISTPTLR